MSERKVVINWLLSISFGAVLSHAAAEPERDPSSRSRKTVGDLLKRIESKTKKVTFEKSKSSLPQFQKSQDLVKPSKVNLTQVKPPSRAALYYEEGTNEAQLEKITDQGIKQLYKLSQQFSKSKRRGELWLRLAELYVEKSRLIEYKLQQKYDEELKDYEAKKSKTKPKIDLTASQEYNKKAIQLYEWFLRDFPNDPKVDQALFFLGYNYFELNQPEKGRDYYQRLTKQYPNSPYIEESNFALGEYHFEREQWADALKYYRAVATNKRARLYSFALYKTAWCEYKTGAVKQALVSLEKVIRDGHSSKSAHDSSTAGVSRIRLSSEAEKDLVIFYAEAGSPSAARSYFQELAGEKQTWSLMEKLAYYYADTGNREGARQIFKQMIAERPNAPKAYDYQYQVVTMFVSSDKPEIFRAELYKWIQNYSPRSEWARANAKDKELVARANQLIETTLRNYTLQQHQTAQNSRVPVAQKVAKESYDLYFQTFKEGQKLDEMHFFYAELLFDMGDFEAASQQYGWIVDNAPKSPYYEKSALNTVLAAEKGLPKEEVLKKQIGDSLDPVPMSKNILVFEAAANRYMKAFPKNENVPAMKYKLGALYYYHNQFDRALDSFNSIIRDYPKSQYAQNSANLTLDIYNLKKDYGGLEKAGQEILNNQDLANTQVGSQVKEVLQKTSFKKAQDLESKKEYAGAAQAYEEFSKKNQGGELATSAAFNSAVNYERASDLFKAIAMYQLVMADRSGKHEDLRGKSSQFVAALFEKTGQYQKAAEAFEAYAAKHPKEKESVAFHLNAAVIRDGLNSYNQALANYQAYFDKAKGAEKFEALFLMAKLQERRGNISKAQEFYKRYYDARTGNAENFIESAYRIAKIHARKGDRDEAETWYKKVIYQQKQFSTKEKPVGVSFAAECKYTMVAKIYDELRAINIPANPARQQAAVQQKLGLLNKLKEQLKEVIRYDDGPSVANSLSLIGQAYQHMASSIFSVPVPKNLDEAGVKEYKAGVEKIAKPFLEEAVKNYESAIKRGFELEGYGEGLKTAQRELNRIDAAKYPDFGERAMLAKLPDTMDVSSDNDLGNPFKSKDEKVMVDAVAKRLAKDQNDLKALNALAVHYMDGGKLGLAKIILTRAQKAHANEPALENNQGVIALSEEKQRLAIADFRKALALKSNYPFAAANLGSIFVEYKDYGKATELLERGYGAVRGDLGRGVGLEVANNYALALSSSGNNDKAKDIFQSILKVDSSNVTALLNYSILLVHRLKDKSEGEKQLNRLKFLAEDSKSRAAIEAMEKVLGHN